MPYTVVQIAEKYTQTLEILAERSEAFTRFSKRFSKKVLDKWKSIPSEPYKDSHGKVHSPYEAQITAGPTQASAYQKLVDEERVNQLANSEDMGDAVLINNGLGLDDER